MNYLQKFKCTFVKIPAMRLAIFLLGFLLFLTACSQTYYVVRHAEKETTGASMGSSDVPLTDKGKQRAVALSELLAAKKIKHIYSTKTIRTLSTAEPTANKFGLSAKEYGPKPDSNFIKVLKQQKGNVLIVGHSNTVDDIVNGLLGKKAITKDLDDSEYNRLFLVKRKGKKWKLVTGSY